MPISTLATLLMAVIVPNSFAVSRPVMSVTANTFSATTMPNSSAITLAKACTARIGSSIFASRYMLPLINATAVAMAFAAVARLFVVFAFVQVFTAPVRLLKKSPMQHRQAQIATRPLQDWHLRKYRSCLSCPLLFSTCQQYSLHAALFYQQCLHILSAHWTRSYQAFHRWLSSRDPVPLKQRFSHTQMPCAHGLLYVEPLEIR